MVQPTQATLPVWQCPRDGSAGKPYIVFRWNSLKAQKNGTPWPAGAQLTFQACPIGAISYTEEAQASAHRRSWR